ncbi:MAG: DUF3445 domain-containing protein [Pseudomonadota bacterium]
MLFSNATPRYLPHIKKPELLSMGLSPMSPDSWIETDDEIGRYHRHKLAQRAQRGDGVYLSQPGSMDAQRELSALLRTHLLEQPGGHYRETDQGIECSVGEFSVPYDDEQPLWTSSLWVADDLIIMQEVDGVYHLTAGSVCCPSRWYLPDKFGQAMRRIHDPIPGVHETLSPSIDRFFNHLRPERPTVRFNWSLQDHNGLGDFPDTPRDIREDMTVYYRSERQSLVRLPESRAIVFTIRVYSHPLEMLLQQEGAMGAMFAAIDASPDAQGEYKDHPEFAPALARYRKMAEP